ncbi:hypothetical protein D3C71_2144020 [compost metagenome]
MENIGDGCFGYLGRLPPGPVLDAQTGFHEPGNQHHLLIDVSPDHGAGRRHPDLPGSFPCTVVV